MNFLDLIEKKKQGLAHSQEEIQYIVSSYLRGESSQEQMAAWLTLVCIKGLTLSETAWLTEALGFSGKVIHYGDLSLRVLDKHSTGGVGDKVTITLIPLLASAGVPVAKLADRTLGYVAGTVDKLESIPEFNTNLSIEAIEKQLKDVNAVIASMDNELAPADKMLYSLRNEIGAVNCDSLIAASIISKKIASGASNIIIDVKYGSGTFMKTPDEALNLAKLIINIGKAIDKNIAVIITSMEEPLGRAVGNSIEVIEAIEFLKGNIDDSDIAKVTYSIATMALLRLDLFENNEQAIEYLKNLVHSGKALGKFKQLISSQGGNGSVVDNYDLFSLPKYKVECESKKDGYVHSINAFEIVSAIKVLGAGRQNFSKPIDLSVGVYLNKKSGEYVNKGDVLYTIYSNSEEATKIAQQHCDDAFCIKTSKAPQHNLIYKIISTNDEDDDV